MLVRGLAVACQELFFDYRYDREERQMHARDGALSCRGAQRVGTVIAHACGSGVRSAAREALWCCGQLSASLPMLHPSGRVRTAWNVLMAVLIIYCGAMVPFEVAFERTMLAEMGVAGWRKQKRSACRPIGAWCHKGMPA